MGFVLGKVYPGIKTRTSAYIAGGKCIAITIILVIEALICLINGVYREDPNNPTRTQNEQEIVSGYYGVGFVVWGTWFLMTCVMLAGVSVENKRALGFWLVYTLIYPLYLIAGIIFFVATKYSNGYDIVHLVTQGVLLIFLIWASLAVWVYFGEIRTRDKNPELRVDDLVKRKENEMMFAQPGIPMMGGSMNPGYGAGSSMGSMARSHRSRHTYAPTETGSVRGSSMQRQSRKEQYMASQSERGRLNERSPEREGGTTLHRYEYNAAEQKPPQSTAPYNQPATSYQPAAPYQPAAHRGSQSSIGRASQPPPARPLYASRGAAGSQGSLVRGEPAPRPLYQTSRHTPSSHHGSQGSLGRVGEPEGNGNGRSYQPRGGYTPSSYQPRSQYQSSHHGSQGSIGRLSNPLDRNNDSEV